jgi:hypothetical protein
MYKKREEYLISVVHWYMLNNNFLVKHKHKVRNFIVFNIFIFILKVDEYFLYEKDNEVSVNYVKDNIVLETNFSTDVENFKVEIRVTQDVHSGRRNGALYGRKRRFTALIFTLFHSNPSVRITTAVSGRFSPVYSRFRPFTHRSVGPG